MIFLKFFIKIFFMVAVVALMAVPAGLELLSFRADKKKKISYKRLRTVIFTLVYTMAATVLMCFAAKFIEWLKTWSVVEWLAANLATAARKTYTLDVYAAIIANIVIGAVFVAMKHSVNVGIENKNLTVPENGTEFSILQKIERAVIRFLNTETWFFVGTVLKYLNIALFSLYGITFFVYQIPAVFGADWIPYKFISSLFNSGYIYPVITLLGTLELYFFLEGVKLLENECPEILAETEKTCDKTELCLDTIDAEVKKHFGNFYVSDVELTAAAAEELAISGHDKVTGYIAKAAESDRRGPVKNKEIYLDCIDELVKSDKSVLINGNFFSEFSTYFLRYISIILARGDNVAFVCNSDLQTDDVYDYLMGCMAELSSLYCSDSEQVTFDNPIWKIVKINESHSVIDETEVDDASVIVTSLSYLCSAGFENEHRNFINLLDTVVLINSAETVNTFNRQLSIFNTKLKHITGNNATLSKNSRINRYFKYRYMAKKVRYICFDDTRIPGLDKVLKNMLDVDFVSKDATSYGSSAVVRCYNYDATADEDGKITGTQFVETDEKVDVIMNMAVLCLASGADSVDVFAEGNVPYSNIAETISSNLGQVVVKADGNNIRLNKHRVNSGGYHVVLVMDSSNNLPAALRKYISMASNSPALIVAFSKPYMLRDFYSSNISAMWKNYQIERIPVEDGTVKDAAQKILLKANSGGISANEIFDIASGISRFDADVKAGDINSILRKVLETCGMAREDIINLYSFFEYSSTRDFDESGSYVNVDKIMLRRSGKLFDFINGRDMAVLVCGDSETVLPVPVKRISQHYIAGQNLLHEGKVYSIQKIDTKLGKIYAKLASAGKNEEVYNYIQQREYHVEFSPAHTEYVYPTRHMVLNNCKEDVRITDILVTGFRVPVDVLTRSYFEVDPYTDSIGREQIICDEGNDFLAKQTYRRYGVLENPAYTTESIIKTTHLTANENGALVMAVSLKGEFGENTDKMLALTGVMLNELIKAMFPSVKHEVVVCPVLNGEITGVDCGKALVKQPKLLLEGEKEFLPGDGFTFLIIEDSNTDLGVVSTLMSAGDDVIKTLFAPMYEYLAWYLSSENRSTYLYNGLDHEPDCFDFEGLKTLAELLGNGKYELKLAEVQKPVEYSVCDFCGERYSGADDVTELADGRKMCKKCAAGIVPDNKKALKDQLDRTIIYLEGTYGISTKSDYEICFESTLKIINSLKQNKNIVRGSSDIPLKSFVDNTKKIYLETTVPEVSLAELIVRELTYAWQMKNLPELDETMAQGLIALVSVQYLNFMNCGNIVALRSTYYESTENISGEGYRRLAAELLENPQFKNNPFSYLLEMCGKNHNDYVERLPEPAKERGEFGKPYNPENVDRVFDGKVKYFYYSLLEPKLQKACDIICEGVKIHAETVQVEDCTNDDITKVMYSIWYDRPEFFWLESGAVSGNTVYLYYGATEDETAELQNRIDLAVPGFLEGIDNSMSAYDVAIRVHDKVMHYVDYDTVALNREKQNKGANEGKIDYIRTICGVFIDGKAVCEGYARAVAYLLQKCGIECAEVAGDVRKAGRVAAGGHAWNILKVDGDYYFMDATWDDNSNTIQKVKRTDTGLDYFCVTTEEILKTRTIDNSTLEVPVCTATRANYYVHNDLMFDMYDSARIREIAVNAAKNKEQFFTFKCTTAQVYDTALNRLFSGGKDCFEALEAASKVNKLISPVKYSYSYNDDLRTITIRFRNI